MIAVDIGNSTTVIGLMNSSHRVIKKFVLFSGEKKNAKKVSEAIKVLSDIELEITQQKSLIGISTVVPDEARTLAQELDRIDLRYIILPSSAVRDFKIEYQPISSLGTDRLCGIIAARKFYSYPSIIIDFGTAITVNILDSKGNFIGGMIAPGYLTMIESLQQSTAQLPNVNFNTPKKLVGNSTIESMYSGCYYIIKLGIKSILKILKNNIRPVIIIVTGGMGDQMKLEMSSPEIVFDPNLVLEGISLFTLETLRSQNKFQYSASDT